VWCWDEYRIFYNHALTLSPNGGIDLEKEFYGDFREKCAEAVAVKYNGLPYAVVRWSKYNEASKIYAKDHEL
jgi:hypothetical protein